MPLTRRAWCLGCIAAFVAACDRDDHGTATSASATPSATSSAAPRVVSLSPSTTEAMFAIGRGALLVARSQHCDHPAEALALPSIGGYASPNVEAILALQPQVVIGAHGPAGPALEQKLRAHGMETLFPQTESVAEVTSMIGTLGARFDAGEAATRVSAGIRARIEAIARWAKDRPTLRVVMAFDVSPLAVAGPGSFADELIALAGARNAIVEGGRWPTIDVERLLTLDPDVIIDGMNIGHGALSQLGEAPGWSALAAVKQGRVRRLRSAAALRPGPRLGDGLADVAWAIHGEDPP